MEQHIKRALIGLLLLCMAKPVSAIPIHGQVLSAEGRPLRGAEIALAPVPSSLTSPAGLEDVKASVVADERGDFALDAPGPGMWRLRLSASGHRAAVCDLLPLLDALEIPPVTLPRGTGAATIVKASPPLVRCRVEDAGKGAADPAPGRPVELLLLAPDEKPAAGVKAILADGTVYGPSDAGGRLQIDLSGSEPREARFWNADGAWAAVLLRPSGPIAPVRLRPAAPIAGTVLDRTTSRPLPRVLIWPAADPGRAVWTDDQGRFTLRVPFLDAPALQAAAPGYQVATARSDRSPREGLTVSLAPAAAVAGLVVDEAGRPVPGAEIEAFPTEAPLPEGEVSGWSRTDSLGRFRLDGLRPKERLTARVLASGFALLESPMPPLAPEPATPVRLALQRGRTVVGTIVDAAGSPIQGAEVLAYPLDPAAQPESLLRAKAREMRGATGRDGTFSLPAVGAGQIDLALRAAGAGPKWLRGVDVPPGQTPLDLGRIVLGPESPLRGSVIDEAGSPVSGAKVTAVPLVSLPRPGDFAASPPATLTDEAGQFALRGLEEGVKVLLRGEQAGFLPATLEVALAVDPAPVLLTLKPAAALRGSVVDEEAKPVEGARVVLVTQAARGDRPLATSASDRTGAFTFAAVPPGSHRLAVQAAGYLAWSQPLTVDSGSPPEPVEVRLKRGAVLSGRVLSERGQPVEGAEVSLSSEGEPAVGLTAPQTISDAEGSYRLEGLPAGPQRVQVVHPDYLLERRQVQLEETETTRDFTLRSGAALAGRVVDDRNEPVAGAMVSVVAEENPVGIDPRWTDAEGRFRVTGLAPARYSVLVELAGYSPAERTGVEVGGRASDLLIRLDRGATLFGQIHGLRAEERSRLQVWATGPARAQVPGTVDGEGRYRIPNLGAGAWRISARAEGLGREVSAPLDLAPDQHEAFLDLEFATGYALAGVVTRGGDAVEGALVSVQGGSGELAGAVTGPQGRFRIELLVPGQYRVAVLDRATGAQGTWTLDLDNDLETTFDLPAPAQAARPSPQTEP